MVFSSISFLYYFIPSVVLLYFLSPDRFKNSVLLLASLFFYGWGEPRYVILMLATITQGYVFGILIGRSHNRKRSKIFLTASVLCSLATLGCFKYADFFIENFNRVTGLSLPLLRLALPIGISFYTFQILSYVVDVYRRQVPAQKNYIDLAVYVAMFPQLIAGPIVRYSHIAGQLKGRSHSLEDAAAGIRRFLTGLSKKVLLADTLGQLAEAFRVTKEQSVLFCWLYAAAILLQIYFDFSGYSDMAIGLGRLFGFRFPENFNYPYISGSITEFWRRWHMSLGSWFRDYLYIPLGGNRVSRPRWFCNILLVWLATGLWHGAAWNFVLWGLMFGALLVLEKQWLLPWLKRHPVPGHFYVLLLITVSFVLFDSPDISSACSVVVSMFGGGKLPLVTTESLYYLKSYGILLAAGLIGATPLLSWIRKKIQACGRAARIWNGAEPVLLAGLLAVCTAFLIDGSFHPFLYFRF